MQGAQDMPLRSAARQSQQDGVPVHDACMRSVAKLQTGALRLTLMRAEENRP
jgi:hypothetical protein